MPMPALDPSRFFAAVLADPSHTLPLPSDLGGRNFFSEGEVVDSANPFYAAVLADGSLKRKPAEAPVLEKPAEPKSAEPEAEHLEKRDPPAGESGPKA